MLMHEPAQGSTAASPYELRVMLAILAGNLTVAEAKCRLGLPTPAVAKRRDRFVESGKIGPEGRLPTRSAPGLVDDRASMTGRGRAVDDGPAGDVSSTYR